MKKIIWTLIMVYTGIAAFAQIPDGYYDDAEGLSGAPLKTALYHIIKDHSSQSYSSIWTHFESTDPKPNGKVWDMYSDVPGGTPPYEYTFGSDQCGNYGGEGDCYNREHSFPKSWFNDASPMNTDIFHIVPTDGYVNGQRSNWPFGETNSPSWTSMNGSKRGSNSTSGYSGIIFEPIDEYKGDFARIYFYMATRYENVIASWENNSTNADVALDGSTFPVYEEWHLNLLLDWDQNDPVDQKEIDRNNEIYNIQNNRNPFVDHTEYVAMVWGGAQAPAISNVNYNPEFPDENEAVTISATITDDGSISSAIMQWGYSSSNLNNNVNMSGSGSSYTAQIPGQSAGQAVYFRIEATDNESNTTISAIFNYQVNQNAGTIALPFTEDFNDETLGIFYEMSVTGPNQFWYNDDHEGAYYAKMSNYDGNDNQENEDWIITPAINFNSYSDEVLTFTSAMNDYSDNSTFIYLLYSTNYSGSGNPNNASWTDISDLAAWSDGDYAWTPSGDISLASITGTQVYIAFKYDSQSESGKTWQIDDVSITIDNTTNNPPQISNVDFAPQEPVANEEVIVSAQITDDNSIESALVLWGYEASNLSELVEMSSTANDYSGTIPGQDEGVTIYFKVQAFDDEGAMAETTIYQYMVEITSGTLPLPFMENFENGDLGIFGEYSVTGPDQLWHNDDYDDNLYAKMSNYNGSDNLENEDWMITPAINFDNYSDEILQFRSSMQDYSDVTTFLYLKISSNYDGVSNPNAATWTNFTSEADWSEGDYEWIESGEIDLSGISGSSVYLAFQYVSQDGSGKTWQVDNVSVTLNGSSNTAPEISNVNHSPEEPDYTDIVTVTAVITDDQSVSLSQLYYGTSPVEMTNLVNMSGSGSNYSGLIPAQNVGTTIYYRIKAQDNDGAVSYSSIYNYYVDVAEGISETQQQLFSFYPNPANGYIQINTESGSDAEVLIIHSSGKAVLQTKLVQSNSKLDISSLVPGYYLIQIYNGQSSSTQALVIYR